MQSNCVHGLSTVTVYEGTNIMSLDKSKAIKGPSVVKRFDLDLTESETFNQLLSEVNQRLALAGYSQGVSDEASRNVVNYIINSGFNAVKARGGFQIAFSTNTSGSEALQIAFQAGPRK